MIHGEKRRRALRHDPLFAQRLGGGMQGAPPASRRIVGHELRHIFRLWSTLSVAVDGEDGCSGMVCSSARSRSESGSVQRSFRVNRGKSFDDPRGSTSTVAVIPWTNRIPAGTWSISMVPARAGQGAPK